MGTLEKCFPEDVKKVEDTTPIVILSHYDLTDVNSSLKEKISTAFGSDGLGILFVRDVPGYVSARSRLLPLGRKFTELDPIIQEKYVHSASCYSFGWSHGKEKLQGRPDLSKGSYYANPQYDRPVDDEEVIAEYPSFVHPNIWPREDLPEMEPAFKELGQMIVSTGILVARHCDLYVHSICPTYPKNQLESIISSSRCCKARLLHYFPNSQIESCEHDHEVEKENVEYSPSIVAAGSVHKQAVNIDEDFSSWCGWHNDHGSLTGLTAAILLDKNGALVTESDPSSGLYVRNRKSQLVKVVIPPDCIAFQIGETAQIHSGGILQATPHAVRGSQLSSMRGVTRETFVVFMEPMWSCPMAVPEGSDPLCAQTQEAARNLPAGVSSISSRWNPEQDFGEFTRKSLETYY